MKPITFISGCCGRKGSAFVTAGEPAVGDFGVTPLTPLAPFLGFSAVVESSVALAGDAFSDAGLVGDAGVTFAPLLLASTTF